MSDHTQLNAAQVNVLVERLVKTVARAFYMDNYVIVLDALVREKYIKESELAPRLRLKVKDVRAILSRLETKELLIKHESLLARDEDGKNRQHNYYYIDYQFFVDIVRYRLFLMKRKVDAEQSEDIQEIKFQCPTCKWTQTMLEATRARSKDLKFVCTKCCPFDNFRERNAEEHYTMVSMEAHIASLRRAGSLKEKLEAAMSMSPMHDSIFAMLKSLNGVKISRNLPSDNIRLGFRNTSVTDDALKDAIAESLGKAVAQKKGRFLLENDVERSRRKEENVSVEIEEVTANGGGASKASRRAGIYDDEDEEDEVDTKGRKRSKRSNVVPEFLTRSGVTGADEVFQLESLNATTSFKLGQGAGRSASEMAQGEGDGDGALAVKSLAPRVGAGAVAMTSSNRSSDSLADNNADVERHEDGEEDGEAVGGEDGEDDEDIAWEDDV